MPPRLLLLFVACALASACHETAGGVTTRPLAGSARSEFATRIKKIRLRAITTSAAFENTLHSKPDGSADHDWLGREPEDGYMHHPEALAAAVRILRAKGYEVTVIWEHPNRYGANRDPKRPDGYRGFPIVITKCDLASSLADDEAFMELATAADVHRYTTTKTEDTETEVARVTDAAGNTTAHVYAEGQTTRHEQHEDRFASATVQVFVKSQANEWPFTTPKYTAQAWTEQAAELVPVVERALAGFPDRHAP